MFYNKLNLSKQIIEKFWLNVNIPEDYSNNCWI
jgi:hypothetical protein